MVEEELMSFLSRIVLISLMSIATATSAIATSGQTIFSVKVDTPPIIDGDTNEPIWSSTKPVPVKDKVSGAMIILRSVYTDDKVYFSVWFPDLAENRLHKPWMWDKDKEVFEIGPHREDTFIFKWSMMDDQVDLSNFSDDNYTADLWYWKANRTNPAGYADDKTQTLSDSSSKKATEIKSTSGKTRFLVRSSDSGKSAYREVKPNTFSENTIDHYPKSKPEGSRADVVAKGKWNGGFWTIEFERQLETGYEDDLQFNVSTGKDHLFGISIFSLYGRPHDPNSPNLYGRGRISDPLILTFK